MSIPEALVDLTESPHSPFGTSLEKPLWRHRIVGVAVVGYLLALLWTFRVLVAVLPRVGWVVRLEQRWTDLWMR
jgi:hypothetical protein